MEKYSILRHLKSIISKIMRDWENLTSILNSAFRNEPKSIGNSSVGKKISKTHTMGVIIIERSPTIHWLKDYTVYTHYARTDYAPTMYWIYTDYTTTIHRLCTDYTQTIHRLYNDYTPTTHCTQYTLHTDYTPSTLNSYFN